MRCALLALATVSIATLSHAKVDCKKAMTTLDINACAQADFEVVEKKLNDTYRRVMKSLSKPDEGLAYAEIKKGLIEAQRAWVVFRQKDCDAYYTLHASGTIRTVMYIGCMQNHAEQRIKTLEEYAL
jgi:uncharacterized protein YecT (DUF1311 family)